MRPLPRAPDPGHYEAASDGGGERAAAMYTLIDTAKLNGINPRGGEQIPRRRAFATNSGHSICYGHWTVPLMKSVEPDKIGPS